DGGRTIKRDVEEYTPQATSAKTTPVQSVATAMPIAMGEESHTDLPLSQMRTIIAKRLSESKFSAPHFYLRMTVTMDKAMDARKAINEVAPVKISFNDMIIKPVALPIRKQPEDKRSWMGDTIRKNRHIHKSSAVAVAEGLIVPVIKLAQQKSLSQISDASKEHAERARNKKLQATE